MRERQWGTVKNGAEVKKRQWGTVRNGAEVKKRQCSGEWRGGCGVGGGWGGLGIRLVVGGLVSEITQTHQGGWMGE